MEYNIQTKLSVQQNNKQTTYPHTIHQKSQSRLTSSITTLGTHWCGNLEKRRTVRYLQNS